MITEIVSYLDISGMLETVGPEFDCTGINHLLIVVVLWDINAWSVTSVPVLKRTHLVLGGNW